MQTLEEYRGLWFSTETPQKVKDVLANAHNTSYKPRLRLYLGDAKTGKPWLEENDVLGYIGRSTGTQKVPLLIYSSNSHGGGRILDHCIVAIQDTNKNWLYKHEGFNVPNLTKTVIGSDNEYPVSVALVGGGVVARFKTELKANNWIKFMTGQRMAK